MPVAVASADGELGVIAKVAVASIVMIFAATNTATRPPSPQARPRRQRPPAPIQPSATAPMTAAITPFWRTCMATASSNRAPSSQSQRRPGVLQARAAWARQMSPAIAVLAKATSFQTIAW